MNMRVVTFGINKPIFLQPCTSVKSFLSSEISVWNPFMWLLFLVLSYPFLVYMTKKAREGSKKACAACKHQRRKCADNCLLAPYFPAEQQQNFVNAHRLFGIGNIQRILKRVPDDQKEEAAKSIIFESNLRAQNPVRGVWGVILQLQNRLQAAMDELIQVKSKLPVFRTQQEGQQYQDFREQEVCNYENTEQMFVPEGFPYQLPLPAIPIQRPLLVSQDTTVQMPIVKGNQQAILHSDDRKLHLGKKLGAYYVDKSLDNEMTRYPESKRASSVEKLLNSDRKPSVGSKGASQSRKVESLQIEGKTEEKGRVHIKTEDSQGE